MPELPAYILQSGPELDRLRLQAKMWQPETEGMLDVIGVQPGWHCIDLGCGALGILEPLSQRVGLRGTVLGLDSDDLQLASARAYVQEKGLQNVQVLKGDAYNTGFPKASFDLVHVRFLFAPVGRDSELLREMLDLVKPGGLIIIQEPDASSWNCWPQHQSWKQLIDIILETFKTGGGDFNAGCRMFAMLHNTNLEQVQLRSAVLSLPGTHPYANLPIQFATSLEKRILASNSISKEALDELKYTCSQALLDPNCYVTSFIVNQVWGYKPSKG